METSGISYLLQVAVCMMLLLVPYLWMRKDSHFRLRRFYLWGVYVCAFLLPLSGSLVSVPASGYVAAQWLEPVRVGLSQSVPVQGNAALPWLFLLWISGLALVLGFMAAALFRLYRWSRSCPRQRESGFLILKLPDDSKGSFSFFRMLFLAPSDYHSPLVRKHELAHAAQWHSLDVLISRTVCALLWFFPPAWWMAAELRRTHEYLADREVLRAFPAESYKNRLLASATGVSVSVLTHSFSMLTLKNRFVMMNRNSSRLSGLKVLVAIPLLGIAFFSFTYAPSHGSGNFLSFVVAQEPENQPDKMPEYPGGQEALFKYISSTLVYPETAFEAGKEGRVVVSFVVDAKGKVTQVKVLRSFDEDCSKEALRVVKAMPAWTPGERNGKPVNVEMTLPIQFKLND